MPLRIFEVFASVIARLPPQAVLKAIDLECNMLESDAKDRRLPLPADAFSLFYFREFVCSVKLGKVMRGPRPLPSDHVQFFRETIMRLVQANELPPAAMEQFDSVFPCDLCS
jgi:hypothetical protein